MNMIKAVVRQILFGYKSSSDNYVKYLKKIGVEVGENVIIFRPFNTTIDVQNPELLYIGNDVQITGPVTILTHDYAWSVLKKKYGPILGNQRPTIIGDNVFIGWGATILGGTVIGNNTIIGAGAVVSGTLEKDSVYAGNPVRKLMSIDDYFEKRVTHQLDDAFEIFRQFYKKNETTPPKKVFKEYFFLFENDSSRLISDFSNKMHLMRNYDESAKCLDGLEFRKFNNYDSFIEYCKKRLKRCGYVES